VTIVDAEELGGAMTEKLAELFDENAAPPESAKLARPRRGRRAALARQEVASGPQSRRRLLKPAVWRIEFADDGVERFCNEISVRQY